jgi:DNA-binding NtrC family response regulator
MKLLNINEKGLANLLSSVLIIDDEAEIRDMLSSVLEDDGYSVETAENGKDAIKKCKNMHFDVALIDIDLPDIKGTELLPKLKEMDPKMVKIIITGHPSIENAVKSVNERSDGYILKPFNIPALLETIKRLIAEKSNEYFQMFTEVEKAKKDTPLFKYQHPDRW